MAAVYDNFLYSLTQGNSVFDIEDGGEGVQEGLENAARIRNSGDGSKFQNIWSSIWGEQGAATGLSNIFSSIFGGVAMMNAAKNTTTQNINTTSNDSGSMAKYLVIGGVVLAVVVVAVVLIGRRDK